MEGARTTVFMNGGSQAVRIPKEFRFDSDEVLVSRCEGGLVLRPLHRDCSLGELFRQCDELDNDDRRFLEQRPCNVPPKAKELFA